MRVLFLEDDGLGRAAPYLRSLGHQPVVLRSGVYDHWHRNECDGLDLEVRQVAKDCSGLEFLDAALALRPDALVSLALLDPQCWRDAIVADFLRSSRGIPVVANSPASVLMANDKLRTKSWLAEHGIPVTRAIRVTTQDEALAAAAELGYPVVLKRVDGYSGMGMRLFRTPDELRRHFGARAATVLLEHFAHGIELSVDVLRWDGEVRALSVIHKGATDEDLRRHPIYRLRTAPAPIDAAHRARAIALAEQAIALLGIVGLAECELILDPVRGPMVLEVNPRIAGTAPLTAACTGIDLHRCLVDMALGRFRAAQLAPQDRVAVQIPVHGPIGEAALERIRALPQVHFIKPINWVPDLGISASLTVSDATPEDLLHTLRELGRLCPLQPGLDEYRRRFAAQLDLATEIG